MPSLPFKSAACDRGDKVQELLEHRAMHPRMLSAQAPCWDSTAPQTEVKVGRRMALTLPDGDPGEGPELTVLLTDSRGGGRSPRSRDPALECPVTGAHTVLLLRNTASVLAPGRAAAHVL